MRKCYKYGRDIGATQSIQFMELSLTKKVLSLSNDLWKIIFQFCSKKDNSTECNREEAVQATIKMSLICRSSAVFVRNLWSNDKTFYEFISNKTRCYRSDPFTHRSYQWNPHKEFSLEYDNSSRECHRNLRAMATLQCTTYCSVCQKVCHPRTLDVYLFLRKVVCKICAKDNFITYKQLYIGNGLDLSSSIDKKRKWVDGNSQKAYKKQRKDKMVKEDCLLSYYFEKGGFAARYPVGVKDAWTSEKRNSRFHRDNFGNIFFYCPVLVFWKKDIYNIFDIEHFGLRKRILAKGAETIAAYFKQKTVENTINKFYMREEWYQDDVRDDKEEWSSRIVRNAWCQSLKDETKERIFSELMSDEMGFYLEDRIETMKARYFMENNRRRVLVEANYRSMIDKIAKENHNKPKALKPGPKMMKAIELWCSKILNHGFGMTDNAYIEKMDCLIERMVLFYKDETWALC